VKAIQKDFWREVKNTRSRFISILILVALAVAFLSGLRSTAPDMKATCDIYMDEQNFMDIQIMATLGLTEEDVENGMEALSEFELDPDNPDDRMTVIRENGSIIAFAAVNDMQEDAVIEITVECDPAYRRKGYGRACVIALTKYFMNRGLEVKYLCDEDNEASMATAESAGFTLYSRVLPMVYYRREEDEE